MPAWSTSTSSLQRPGPAPPLYSSASLSTSRTAATLRSLTLSTNQQPSLSQARAVLIDSMPSQLRREIDELSLTEPETEDEREVPVGCKQSVCFPSLSCESKSFTVDRTSPQFSGQRTTSRYVFRHRIYQLRPSYSKSAFLYRGRWRWRSRLRHPRSV